MNTILTNDERPKLPEPRVPKDGHTSTWAKFSAAQMEAYADAREAAVLAKLREQEPLTDSYVQPVPDKCDRIVWRGRYYHLPIAAPLPAVVQVPQCVGCQQVDYCKANGCINAAMNTAPEAPAQGGFVHDPACKMCEGRGYYVAGYSGREDDGNAPIHEECDCWIPNPEAPAQGECDALRAGQAAAVMPLIGPLLDAWDRLPNDMAMDDELSELKRIVKAINHAMEAAQPSVPAPWREAVKVMREALASAKRWHQGDKWRDDCTAEQRAAWEEHAANLDAAIALADSLEGGE